MLWDKYKVKEFDVSSVVMSSRSILFYFKKPVNTVNNGADVVNIPESSCPVVNSDLNSEKVSPFQIVFHYQKSLIIHRKVLCFQKLTLDLEILVLASITALITIHGCIMTLRKIVKFVFIAWRRYQNWQQEKTKNQHTYQSNLKIGKKHPRVLKTTKTVNATKKQNTA